MIRKDLLDFQYYINRLSKFMQESYGVTDQMRFFYELLKRVNEVYDEYIGSLNIFKNPDDPDYKKIEGDLLDKLGAIFGCYRNFTIPIYDTEDITKINSYYQVELTEDEFLIYIKTQIVKQNFDGRREVLQKLYSTYVNNEIVPGLTDLNFIYLQNETESGVCDIYWAIDPDSISEDMKMLFEQGYLTIQSAGIRYNHSVSNIFNFSIYGGTNVDTGITYEGSLYNLIKYTKQTSEPADLATGDYYQITASNATDEWDEENTYGLLHTNDWEIIEDELAGWSSCYSAYKILTITKIENQTWSQVSSNCFKKEELGGLYS